MWMLKTFLSMYVDLTWGFKLVSHQQVLKSLEENAAYLWTELRCVSFVGVG